MTNHEENKMANIQGAYHPDLACLQETESGILLMFRDATYHTDEDSTIVERDMTVGKRRFHVTSVFSNHPTSTATKKMLAYIDANMNAEMYRNCYSHNVQNTNSTHDNSSTKDLTPEDNY